MISKVIYLKQL